MRKLLVLLTAVLALVAFAAPAGARDADRTRGPDRRFALFVHRTWFRWEAGSATNPIFNGGCGEVVNGIYLAPPAVDTGMRQTCVVPAGVPIAVSPAGVFSEIPTWGSNDAEVIADAEATFDLLLFSRLKVDGRRIDPYPWTISAGAYDVRIQTGSALDLFCEGVPEPCQRDFMGGEIVRMASVGQVVLLRPLRPGRHVIRYADRFTISDVLDMTLTVHVRRACHPRAAA